MCAIELKTKFEPMNPAPPVTRMVSFVGHLRSDSIRQEIGHPRIARSALYTVPSGHSRMREFSGKVNFSIY